jgi:hypothetical protein
LNQTYLTPIRGLLQVAHSVHSIATDGGNCMVKW